MAFNMVNENRRLKWLAFLSTGLLLGLVALTGVRPARAAFPDRPIHIVVPSAAGSNSDIIVRQLAPKLAEILGQKIIVDNRSGGSQIVGAEAVARARPDGYTLLFGTSTNISSNPWLFKTLPYDPVKDFSGVALLGSIPLVLFVNKTLPVNSLTDLISYIKARPNQLTWAHTGTGTPQHLIGEKFIKTNDLKIQAVPYNVLSDAFVDMIDGTDTFMVYPYQALSPQIKAGQFKPLATTSDERPEWAKDTPTMKELGLPGLTLSPWIGFLTSSRVPRNVITILSNAIVKALNDPELRKKYEDSGTVVEPLPAEEMNKFLTSQRQIYRNLIELSGAKAE